MPSATLDFRFPASVVANSRPVTFPVLLDILESSPSSLSDIVGREAVDVSLDGALEVEGAVLQEPFDTLTAEAREWGVDHRDLVSLKRRWQSEVGFQS